MKRIGAVVVVLIAGGCVRPQTNLHMWRHYDAAADAHNAVLRGQLAEARSAGRWLAEHAEAEGLPGGSEPLVARMREYGRQVAGAQDVSEAATGTAHIARTCGQCHEAHGPGPVFLGGGVPPGAEDDVSREMRRHGWAAGRMFEGLVGPASTAWEAGARALLDAPLAPGTIPVRDDIPVEVTTMEARVHEIGRRAASTSDWDERVTLYADLISTCAACHMIVRPRD